MRGRAALAVVLLAVSRAYAQAPLGAEFQLNTYTTGPQTHPSIASDPAGNFVATWSSPQDGDSSGVFARRYDASGAPLGAEFRVNTHTTGPQGVSRVACDSSGGFVVVWQSLAQGDYGWGVFGQRYDASGTPRGSEFHVNTYTTNHQNSPSVATDSAGNFVVAWSSNVTALPEGYGIFAQRYDASGARRGGEFRVNTYQTGHQQASDVAMGSSGDFIVAWTSGDQDGDESGIYAQRYDASGIPQGGEFRVNTHTVGSQSSPSVAWTTAGGFVVAWHSNSQEQGWGVFARRYDASGQPQGPEFRVNTNTFNHQSSADVAADAAGNFVVTWDSWVDAFDTEGIFAQRFDMTGGRLGPEFQVNTTTADREFSAAVASAPSGDFVVAWASDGADGSDWGIFGQRFTGDIVPAALAVDTAASAGSDGNRVLEPGESVDVRPSWRNATGAPQAFDGAGVGFTGPPASGVVYQLPDGAAIYGAVANDTTAQCSDCYRVGVTFGGTRPSLHWDATFTEQLAPGGQSHPWVVHVGESFSDVPRASAYYRFVETMLHVGVTGGCDTTAYCPASAVTREQMSVFTLEAREGAGYRPRACTTAMFADVPASSFFCPWIEELARRGVVTGCGGSNFCPLAAVTREQLPVFVLRLLDLSLDPPPCTAPVFADVPASSAYCRWIEELARRGVVTGCGGGNYCPASPVSREQMAVFNSVTYGLTLYGP